MYAKSKSFFHIWALLALLLSVLGSAVTATPARAASLVVTKTADTNDGVCDSDCSLREAITAANSAAGADTITFDSSLSGGIITIGGSYLPDVTENLTVDGSTLASQLTLDGNNAYRSGFLIQSGVTATIKNLTFVNGYTSNGGAIDNEAGALTVMHSVFSNNHSVYYAGGGGAIYNSYLGSLTVTDSTFSGNISGGNGGAIYNAYGSVLTLTNSAFSGNTASFGGGIFNVNNSSADVTNVTFSDNTASNQGGAFFSGGALTLTNVTISGNGATNPGGGIYQGPNGTLSLINTIIANSTSGGDCHDDGAPVGPEQNNLIEDASNACGLANGVNGDLVGSDPQLDSLANNGGSTQTFALLPGSPAIDAGDDTTCAASPVSGLDQRGSARPQGPHCDIGALESALQSGPAYVVTTNADHDGLCDYPVSGTYDCTLREAINASNLQSGPNTITFDSSLSGGTITLDSNLPTIAGDLTIDGSSLASPIIIDGADSYRPFVINLGFTVALDSLNITNGQSTNDPGGAIGNSGNLAISNGILSGNSADMGGGIHNDGTLTVTNSTFSGNSAANGDGGGIYNDGTLTVTSSTFSGNSAAAEGGGIYNIGPLTVSNGTFSGNTASLHGGGIFNINILTLTNSTLSGNSANLGGGIYSNGTLNYANTIIANSLSGGDCQKFGSGGTNTMNLVEDGSCSPAIIGDPALGPLANNGDPTQTMALLSGSPAIDSGDDTICAADPVNNLDQRGVARPQGSHCDIGAFELGYPAVSLSTNSLDFGSQSVGAASTPQSVTVTNSGAADLSLGALSVNGDFGLTNDNCSGQTVAAGSSCTFEVFFQPASTGIKNGEISIPSNTTSSPDSVNLSGTGVITTTVSFKSIGQYDGFMLEKGENTNIGGSANASGSTFTLGDNAYKKQYRAILHFKTAGLPDNAVITGLTLKLKKQGGSGTNPFTVLGTLQVDISNPYFGTGASLAASDFQAAAGASNVGSFDPTPITGNWFNADLTSSAFPFLNLTGTTQFRLAFSLDDNNNSIADTVKFFSGNYSTASYRPVLIVTYYVP